MRRDADFVLFILLSLNSVSSLKRLALEHIRPDSLVCLSCFDDLIRRLSGLVGPRVAN